MKFEVTTASINHGLIATAISGVALLCGFLLGVQYPENLPATVALSYTGTAHYSGREIRDLEKSHKWNLQTWNSAELILPFVFNTIMLGLLLIY